MANPGVAPIDASSLVGQVRLNLGDTNYVPLQPPVDGQGSFDYFSDAAISSLLLAGRMSPTRATGLAIKQLALNFAMVGRSIKTDDLANDNRTRGDSVAAIAQSWIDQADGEDANAASDIFDIIPFPGQRHRGYHTDRTHYVEDPANPGYLVPATPAGGGYLSV